MKRHCGRPIGGGGGVCQKWTNADKGEGGGKNGTFVRTSFMDGPSTSLASCM